MSGAGDQRSGTIPAIVLRPEPGASETRERLEQSGIAARPIALFAIEPLAWTVDDADAFDALLLTSANAVRMAGPGLSALARVPTWCVGPATAAAARAAGLSVVRTGQRDAQSLIDATERGDCHLLWLAGEDRSGLVPAPDMTISAVAAYRAVPIPLPPDCFANPAVILLHSSAAARRLADLVDGAGGAGRAHLSLVAISDAVAAAAGSGWHEIAVSPHPDDAEMVAIAAKLCQKGAQGRTATPPSGQLG